MTERNDSRNKDLAVELVRRALHREGLAYADIEPVLRNFLPQQDSGRVGSMELLHWLLECGAEEAQVLARRLNGNIVKDAVRVAQALRENPEHDWRAVRSLAHLPEKFSPVRANPERLIALLRRAALCERDRVFLATRAPEMTKANETLAKACAELREELKNAAFNGSWISPSKLWSGFATSTLVQLSDGFAADPRADEKNQLAELAGKVGSAEGADAATALQQLLFWPTNAFAHFVPKACVEPKTQAYAMHALALRSGVLLDHWLDWQSWLVRLQESDERLELAVDKLFGEFRDELRLVWLHGQPEPQDQTLVATVTAAVAERAEVMVRPGEFVWRWDHALTPAESTRLNNVSTVAVEKRKVPAEPPSLPRVKAQAPVVVKQEKPAEPEVVLPSVWDEHIKPFLAANWYIIAGLLMVVAGSSLLAYFTWDKSVLVRYLFLPVMLAGFTGGMAELGLRLARRHEDLLASGTFLVGGAVCLLPVNFMVLCRAGGDPQAAGLVLPALGLYASLAGLGLWRWCGSVKAELKTLLGLPLLAVNLLAVLGDMPGVRELTEGHRGVLVPAAITGAVVLVFIVTNLFLRRVLTKELLESKLVPWFFGATLTATLVQVAVWRHFHLNIAINPQDYALAAIVLGALLLRWERRAGELRNNGAVYGGESFLGYAALFLGILMAAGNEWLRILALVLSGVIWLVQAQRRPGVVHHWIGATLVLLCGAAVGMLEVFPKSRELNLLPELGIGLALLAGLVRVVAGRREDKRLHAVAIEIQPPVLLVSSIVAVLSQYNLKSEPWQAGAVLLAVAVFFAIRATREDRQDWLRISAAGAGLALPYLGCADMTNYRFDANTLALGLGALASVWLAAAKWLRKECWSQSGPFLATCMSGAGMIGLGLRLMLARQPVLGWTDFAGGILLAGALGVASKLACSRVQAFMAVGVLAVLLPMFRVPAGVLPVWLHVGSGMVSGVAAFALMLGCFALRNRTTQTEQNDGNGVGVAGLFAEPVLASVGWFVGKALLLQFQHHAVQTPFVVSAFMTAATFYAGAIFYRNGATGRVLFHASWLLLGAGVAMACEAAGCDGLGLLQYTLLWTGVVLTVLLGVEWKVAQRLEWAKAALAGPRLRLLAYGSGAIAFLVAALVQMPGHEVRGELRWLALFFGGQLLWHALRSLRRRFGAVLFLLVSSWLCHWGEAPEVFGSIPVFLLAIFLADLVTEHLPKPRVLLSPLRAPFVAGATLLVVVFAVWVAMGVHEVAERLIFTNTTADLVMILVSLLLAARAQGCAGFALLAVVLGYAIWMLPCGSADLFRPWRLAGLATGLCLLPFAGRRVWARWPRILRGAAPQVPALEAALQAPWFIVSGLVLAAVCAFEQISLTALGLAGDAKWVQILAPFATVGVFSLAAYYWRKGVLWTVAASLLPLANLFAVGTLWGRVLLDAQLTPIHVVSIAAVMTVAQFTAVRWWLRKVRTAQASYDVATLRLHYGCAALAGLVLVLLGVNYLSHPDLARIPTVRFFASGLLALLAGAYFRLAARRPENLKVIEGVWLEACWHVALGLALWCGALLLPAMRTPHAALYALAVPAVACWLAAEWFLNLRQKSDYNGLVGARFRISGGAFSLLLLVLYVFRLPFQLVLFPEVQPGLELFHTGAAAVLFVGFILIRLRGLGGFPWEALVGGLAVMTGVYFNVTWLPGFSPFAEPMAGAWAAVVVAHLLVMLSYQQSPLRSLIQHIGGIEAEEWHLNRSRWGVWLTAGVHGAVISGLLQGFSTHGYETLPLLVALASVLVHQAMIGAPWARAYRVLAWVEVMVGLHLCFAMPGGAPVLLAPKQVVWVLLALWLGGEIFWRHIKDRVDGLLLWVAASSLPVLCAAHLYYHGPATGSGVLIAGLFTLGMLLLPVTRELSLVRMASQPMLFAPLWLAYFGTRWITGEDAGGICSLLAGTATVLGSGILIGLMGERFAGKPQPVELAPARLAGDVRALCQRSGMRLGREMLIMVFAALVLLTGIHPDAQKGSLGLMLAIALTWGVSGVAWYHQGRMRDGVLPYTLSLLSLAGAWILLRRLLFQYCSFWTYEYDVWLSLGASVGFSAAKRLLKHEHPGLGRTMTGAVWLIPVLQCAFLLYYRMNADLTLLVIGIQAMLFAWHGGGKRDSAYNAVSMLGFVGFICLLFWAKLELRCVQAYTIPSGLGVIGLVWLFGKHMQPGLRNAVRLAAVVTMLGSCGYYALLDNSYPVGFHLTMILLCLAVMALGPLLRVQVYLYLGFAGFATDLAALVMKQFHMLDRSTQMVGVGASLLLLGVSVVGGAIYYKTHHEEITAYLGKVRARLAGWE